jgi:hypothetical protein
MVGNGHLVENVNKRSEAANRKYRAFIHFLKHQKNSMAGQKGNGPFPMNKSEASQSVSAKEASYKDAETKANQFDDLSASDADDDFDDRYIHLSKQLSI